MFGQSVSHNGGVKEDDELQDEDVYVDKGDDRMEDIEELKKHIAETVKTAWAKRAKKARRDNTEQQVSVQDTAWECWSSKRSYDGNGPA